MMSRLGITFLCVFLLFVSVYAESERNTVPLRVYHHADYPPVEFINGVGESDGFDVQVFKAIAEISQLNYTMSGVSWDSLQKMIYTGDFDVLTGIYYRVSNKTKLNFSIPLLTITYSLFVPEGSPISDLHDSVSKRVIIVGGGVSSKLVDDLYAVSDIRIVDDFKEAINLLQEREYDCAILPTLQAQYYIKQADINDIISIGPELLSRNLCFVVPAGDSLLLQKIDLGIQKLRASGELNSIAKIWVSPYQETFFSWTSVKKYLFGLIVILLLGGVGIIIWTTSLKRAVITRTRELHHEIRQRQLISDQLAESSELKALLIDIITHDLKNPAAVISGLADMMLAENPDNEMTAVVKRSSSDLLAVIDNATTLSNVELGEEIRKQPLSIRTLLEDVVRDFQNSAQKANMILSLEPVPDVIIQANPIISEIFKNYLSNAIKYASSGGKITIGSTLQDQDLTITVSDFGETIPTAMYEKIFERSFQVNQKTRTGRGLGLAIVKRIASAHNAKVGVRANSPQGNIFYLTLSCVAQN